MRADGSLRPARPPRGLIITTGEDLPRGKSLRARMVIIEISPGEIDAGRLTICQRNAANGLYAQTMAAFLRWAAGSLDRLQARFRERALVLRSEFSAGHARLPSSFAELQAAFEIFMKFAVEATAEQAITRAEADEEIKACREALEEVIARQAAHLAAAEPAARYLELVASAIASGRAHIAAMNGDEPPDPAAWGWRQEGLNPTWHAMGDRIGWVDGDNLYLDPAASLRVAQAQSVQGDGISVSGHMLKKHLQNHGHLVSTESQRGTLTVRRKVEGRRPQVLHIRADAILSLKGDDEEEPEIPI